jgi:hypothetical protein
MLIDIILRTISLGQLCCYAPATGPVEVVPLLLPLMPTSQTTLLVPSQTNEPSWEGLFSKRFSKPTKLHLSAHKLAGSWLTLYRAKVITTKAAEPWRKPSTFELQAALLDLTGSSSTSSTSISISSSASCSIDVTPGSPSCSVADSENSSSTEVPVLSDGEVMDEAAAAAAAAEGDSLAVVFLVDGSGSVGEGAAHAAEDVWRLCCCSCTCDGILTSAAPAATSYCVYCCV